MVFVFSLEDEISFQTVYNYFLRLCSFRNTSEVPMVLVGTQGERACSLGRRGGCGSPVGRPEKAWPPTPPALLALIQPFRCASPTPPPRAGTSSLPPTHWVRPGCDPAIRVMAVSRSTLRWTPRGAGSLSESAAELERGPDPRILVLRGVCHLGSSPIPPSNQTAQRPARQPAESAPDPPLRLRQTPSVPRTRGSSTTAGPASCPQT